LTGIYTLYEQEQKQQERYQQQEQQQKQEEQQQQRQAFYTQTRRIPAPLSKYVLEGKYIDQNACSVPKPTCFGLRTQLTFVLQLSR
jgi:hypothetical protein